MKRSEQRDYLNRIEMKKNEPMNMFIENKRCQSFFFKKQTNNIEVKNTKLPAEKAIKPRTSHEAFSLHDWLVSILNSLHASVCFDPLRVLFEILSGLD